MDSKNWQQNAVRVVRMLASSSTELEEYMLAVAVDLNGYTVRLYKFDPIADQWILSTAIDPNVSGRHLWGDVT